MLSPQPEVVIGLCKHGLFLTRNFIKHQIPVFAIESNFNQPSAKTRYGQKIHCKDLNGIELIDVLLRLKNNFNQPTPIFPTNDKIVTNLINNYDKIKDHYVLPFITSYNIEQLKDKNKLHKIAIENNLNIPTTYTLRNQKDLDEIANKIKFPVIIKPTLPMMSFKSKYCNTLDEITMQLESSIKKGESLLIQEWIQGDDREIFFVGYYISKNGACTAKYSGRKLMSYPEGTGHATVTESYYIPDLVEKGIKFFNQIGYWGLCSIEFKQLNPSKSKFIEVTVGRTDWWIMCCAVNGVNIPMAAYCDITGQDIPFDNKQTNRYVWRDFECELPVLINIWIRNKWSLKERLLYLLKPKKDALFSWKDVKPFFVMLVQNFKKYYTILKFNQN